MSAPPFPRLLLVGAALLFSTGGAAVKASSLGAFEVASARSGIAALTLLVLVPAARRAWSRRTLLVALAFAATMVLFVLANKTTTAANAIFLQSTAPLHVLLLGPLLLREPIHRRDLVRMAGIAAGLGLLFLDPGVPVPTAPSPRLGNALAAAAGLSWGLTLIGLRWVGSSSGEGGMPAVVAGNVLACLATLPLALPFAGASGFDWTVLAYLGVFQIGLAYVLLSRGIRAVSAFDASLLLLVEPVLSPLWAWLAHGERPGPWALAGGALVLGATAAGILRGRTAE